MTDETKRDDTARDETAASPADGDGSAEEVLAEWRVHLLLKNPNRSAAAILMLAIALVLIYLAFRSPWLTILGGIILVGSLSDWFFPIRYRLTTDAASYKNLVFRKRIAWDDVRSVYLSDFGMKLSPFAGRSRLEPFRALIIRFGGAGSGDGAEAPGSRSMVIRTVNERAYCKRGAENQEHVVQGS